MDVDLTKILVEKNEVYFEIEQKADALGVASLAVNRRTASGSRSREGYPFRKVEARAFANAVSHSSRVRFQPEGNFQCCLCGVNIPYPQ
jgi:hypothetical protein